MYEPFSDRARNVMVLANQEAQRFNHEYIGTGHILLGLIKEAGEAAHVLKSFGVDLRTVRMQVEKLVMTGPNMVTMGKLPQTPRAKKVIEYAMEESLTFGHKYVGTEHLLLGLLRDEDGVASHVLLNLGLDFGSVRRQIIALVASGQLRPEPISVSRFQKLLARLFEKPGDHSFAEPPRISKNKAGMTASLVAVDIGNSRMKLGQFALSDTSTVAPTETQAFSEPSATLEVPIVHETGLFDLKLLATWCEQYLSCSTHWSIGSVHRGASELLATTLAAWANHLGIVWSIRWLTYLDVALPIRVEEPARVGIDRLLAAVAANRLRAPDRPAIIVDLGTAITVDLVEADGAFAGGAILPSIAMAGRALAEQTDALPHIVLEHSETPPTPLGKSTKAAIESGLYWGTIGAVGELASQLAAGLPTQPDFFITGGAARTLANSMEGIGRVQYVPHLVLAGIALLDDQASGSSRATTG